MTIALTMKPAGGFGDSIFALKYASELRRQIYLNTGVLEEVVIVSDKSGVDDIQKLRGDSEYQIPLYTPATLRQAVSAGMKLDLVVDGPAADRSFLDTVSDAIEDLVDAPIPLDHVGEYQVASQDTYQGIRQDRIGIFDIASRISSGVPVRGGEKGLLLSPELLPSEEPSQRGMRKTAFLSDLETKLKIKMLGGTGSAADLAQFEKRNTIGFQYAHEYPVTIQGPDGVRPLYPCEKFLKIYFSSIPDNRIEKKHQHIVLVGKGPAIRGPKTFQEDEKYESILKSLEEIHAKGFGKVIFVDVEAGSEQVISDRGEGPSVTFYREKTLPHASIIALLGLSDAPFCGVTGDQSLGEGLSASKIVIYELLQHKAELQSDLTRLLKASLTGSESFKKEIVSKVDSQVIVESLQERGLIDEGVKYGDKKLKEIYLKLITTQAIKCIELIGGDTPEENDLVEIGASMRLEGVVELMKAAHGALAKTSDLVSNNFEIHAEKIPFKRADSESSLVGQFKFSVLTGDQQKAMDIARKIPLRSAFEAIGVDNAMSLCQNKQLNEVLSVIQERALREPSALAGLLSEALKLPSVHLFLSDKSGVCRQIASVSSVEELRKLESLSSVGFTPAMRESLPDDFPLSEIKAQISLASRNAIESQVDIAIMTDCLDVDDESILDPLAIYSAKSYEEFQSDFSSDLQGRLLPVSLITDQDYEGLLATVEQKLTDFLEQRLFDCLARPLYDGFPQLGDIEPVSAVHVEWLGLPEEKASQLIPLIQKLPSLTKIPDYVAKSSESKRKAEPSSDKKMLLLLGGAQKPEVVEEKVEVSEYQALMDNLPQGYIKASKGFIKFGEGVDGRGFSKGHHYELSQDGQTVNVTPVSIQRLGEESRKYKPAVEAINFSRQEKVSELVGDFLVRPFVAGKALSEIPPDAMDKESRLSLVTSYLSELAKIHDGGVLLCNIRPSNVVVDPVGMSVQFVELGDALLYKACTQSVQLSVLDDSVFPLDGMPPESLSECIPASSMDIYASVPILAELLGADMKELMRQKLKDTFTAMKPEGKFDTAKERTITKFDMLGNFDDVCTFGIPGLGDEDLEQFFEVFGKKTYDFSKTGLSQEYQELLSQCQDEEPSKRPSAAECIQMISQSSVSSVRETVSERQESKPFSCNR